MLKIHNTLTGRKETFEPLVKDTARMYVCGVTVYDECHIGHARSALVFDVIRRYLEHRGLRVTFVKNFTDVDDKIINRANELGIPWQDVTARYITAYHRDMGRLGVRPATLEPKATEHMSDIIELVQTLLRKEVAYQVNGDVYFQVQRFPAYGRLSRRKLEDMQAGARVEVDERKRHPMDFALWKSVKPGEPSWTSPWGAGRPGWHIECSAMSMRHLGDTFDIHGGGADLIFPHHENEIAQSSAATGKDFARYWLHNGFVQVNQEKMSKSLGNFFTIREIFETSACSEPVTAEVLRYFLLAAHYRNPLDFSDAALQEAKRALDGFYGLLQRLEECTPQKTASNNTVNQLTSQVEQAFQEAMDDDFNTPEAVAQFQHLRSESNRLLNVGLPAVACADLAAAFRRLGQVVGLFQVSVKQWEFKELQFRLGVRDRSSEPVGHASPMESEIEALLAERNEARKRKDFARADAIRVQLTAQGITIEDRPDGTSRWKR